jgi:hypothetical protein
MADKYTIKNILVCPEIYKIIGRKRNNKQIAITSLLYLAVCFFIALSISMFLPPANHPPERKFHLRHVKRTN